MRPRTITTLFLMTYGFHAPVREFGSTIAINKASASTETKLEGKSDGNYKNTGKVSEDPEGQKAREERSAPGSQPEAKLELGRGSRARFFGPHQVGFEAVKSRPHSGHLTGEVNDYGN